jgi:integrase
MFQPHSDSEDSDTDSIGSASTVRGHRMPEYWRQKLAGRRPPRPVEALNAGEWATLLEAFATTMGSARADSTWAVLRTVYTQFTAFDDVQCRGLRAYQVLELDQRMIMWHLWKLQKREISRSTPFKYCKILIQLYRRMTHDAGSILLSDYKKALRRAGYHLADGARPATVQELQRLVASRETISSTTRMQILTMWLLCARTDDVRRLQRKDITLRNTVVTVTWNAGTKSGARPLESVMTIPRAHLAEWTREVMTGDPNAHPFPLDCDQISRAMRHIAPDLTSHSIKKGSLTYLISKGAPLQDVAFRAHHDQLDQLRTYVGEHYWALAHHADEMGMMIAEAWE